MSSFSISRFNWLRTSSAWESTQIWHAKQQAARADFESLNSSASSAFFGASNDFATGMVTIAARIANDRLKKQVSATTISKLV